MARNKEYEMLFKLAAQLNSNFNGTFSSAQRVLAQTQKKITELNRTQADISSYQSVQKGIEKQNEKLQMYQKQLSNTQNALAKVRSQMEATERPSQDLIKAEAELANKELTLRNRINDTQNSIADKNLRLQTMTQRLSEAGVDVNNLTGESSRLNFQLAELARQEEQAGEEARNMGNRGQDALSAIGDAMVAAGLAEGFKKIAEAMKECIDLSMQFGSTMSTVEALSGSTVQEMQSLSDQAKQLGATTVFTANEAASAMTYMGMAGWDAQDMLNGMNGVMSLASASGEDLAMVSDIVTDNLTAFGLSAKDTAHFADVLAAAATNSNTNVAIMGETFSGSAAIAGALGYSIEDVATAVGAMANAGVKGSIAGTALKNIFNGLLSGVTLTGEALGDVEFTAVNADGTMKGFSQTIDELRSYFDQMTESERVNNAMAIAGQRGYNGLLAILNTTDAEYQALSNDINNCTGAAEKMSKIKLDNLQGDVTLAKSAFDGLKMSIGELYQDDLRKLVQMGTQVLNQVNEFVKANPALVKGVLSAAAAAGSLLVAYKGFMAVKNVVTTVKSLSTALNSMSASAGAANAALAMSPKFIGGVAIAVTALVAAVTVLRECCKQIPLEQQTITSATEEQQQKVTELTAAYDSAVETYGRTSDKARALKYDLDSATEAVQAQSFSVGDLYTEIESLHSSTADLISAFDEGTGKIAEQQEEAQNLTAKMREIASSSATAAQKQALLEPIIARLNELYPELGLTVQNASDKLNTLSGSIDRAAGAKGIKAKSDAAKSSLTDLYAQQKKLQSAFEEANIVYGRASQKMAEMGGNYAGPDNLSAEAIASNWKLIGNTITGVATQAKDEWEKAGEELSYAQQDLAAINEKIKEAEQIQKEYADIVSGTSEQEVSAYDAITIATDSVTESTTALLEAYNNAYSAAFDSITGQFSLWDEAATVVPTTIDTINKGIDSQIIYWESYNDNLDILAKKSQNIEGLNDVIAGFADGSKDSVAAVAGLAQASDEQLKRFVESQSKLREEQNKASDELAKIKTNFDDNLLEITNSMESSVEKMNMSDEARKAAEDTIAAYTAGIKSGLDPAVSAAAAVANATTSALSGMDTAEIIKNMPKGYKQMTLNAYASGTDYAAPGFALVGEQGPELVAFKGGEKVIDYNATRSALSGTNNISISPSFVINSNGGNIDDGAMNEISDKIVNIVMNALDEAGIDNRRAAYV